MNYSIPIDLLPLNVVVYRYKDGAFIFVDVNKQVEVTEGIKKEEVLGRRLCDVFPGVKSFGLLDVLLRVSKQGGNETFEKAFYKDERISGWRKNKIFKLPNGDIMAIYEDLTLMKKLEEESDQYKQQLQELGSILDHTMNEVFIFDVDTLLFTYVNQSAQDNIGYNLDELRTMTPVDIKPEYTMESFCTLLEPLRNGEREYLLFETLHRRKNGSEYNVQIRLQLMKIEDKKRFVVIAHDITQEHKREEALQLSEKKYKDLVENAMIGVYRSDLSGTVLYVNQALVGMLGFDSSDELIGKKSILRYNDSNQRGELIQSLLKEHHLNNYELELLDKNKHIVPVMISATLDGDIIFGMIIDMRELNKSREEIEKLSKVVEQIDDSVVITDKAGTITYVNQAFCDHTGYLKSEVLGENPSLFKSDKHDDKFYEGLWRTILDGDIFRGMIVNIKKNGDLYYENKTITPLKDDKNHIIGFVSSGKDVTEETLLYQEIERMATIDKLTGLCNRHKFEELFALEAEKSIRFSLPLSIILIDIDHFKSVNDTYGHDVGDEVLKCLADILQESIRKIDIVARWGGEEFLVLCSGTDLNQTRKLAEKLCKVVESASFPTIGHVTISLGVSTFKKHDTFSKLFKDADRGLYHAKERGRNQVGLDT